MDVRDSDCRFPRQAIDVPELGRVGMGVEQIVDAERSAPALRKGVMRVEVPFAEPLAVDLTLRGESGPIRVLAAAASVASGAGRRSVPRLINPLRCTNNH